MTNIETKITHIEIPIDSEVWLKTKHALREAGYKFYFQTNLFDHSHVNLFLEPRAPEPEGGKLSHGLLIYEGGCQIGSTIQEVYDSEIAHPFQILDRPAVKSSTSVASASTVCSSCGCRIGPNQTNTKNCQCRCHGTDRVAS